MLSGADTNESPPWELVGLSNEEGQDSGEYKGVCRHSKMVAGWTQAANAQFENLLSTRNAGSSVESVVVRS